MRTELDALHQALPTCDWLSITDRAGGAIKLTPLDAAPEPRNLRRLKQAVQARWGTVPLIDMLKEAVLRTGCLRPVTSVAGHGSLPEHVLAERLLLAIYGYGTNTGIRAVAAGEHGHGEDEIRYRRGGAADRDRDPEHLHRVALPLRRPRRAHLLARRARLRGDSLPEAELFGLGGARDG